MSRPVKMTKIDEILSKTTEIFIKNHSKSLGLQHFIENDPSGTCFWASGTCFWCSEACFMSIKGTKFPYVKPHIFMSKKMMFCPLIYIGVPLRSGFRLSKASGGHKSWKKSLFEKDTGLGRAGIEPRRPVFGFGGLFSCFGGLFSRLGHKIYLGLKGPFSRLGEEKCL